MADTRKGENYMDAPNARPSEEAYNDAMTRHGTQQFTPNDAKTVNAWHAQNTETRDAVLDGTGYSVDGETDEVVDDRAGYDEWKVDRLQKELRDRELTTSGNKQELIQRLKDHDEQSGSGRKSLYGGEE